MKNIKIALLLLICVLLTACGGPTAKEEAQRLDKEYMQVSTTLFKEEYIKKLDAILANKPTSEQDALTVALSEEYKPKFIELQKKLMAEKPQSSNKKLFDLLLVQLKNQNNILEHFILLKDKNTLNKNNYQADGLVLGQAMLNTGLEYNNEYSMITTGKGTYDLTLANYQRVHKGDDYRTIAKLFKMPGTLTTSNESNMALIGHRKLDVYIWEQNNVMVKIMFENGKAYMLEQRGLK